MAINDSRYFQADVGEADSVLAAASTAGTSIPQAIIDIPPGASVLMLEIKNTHGATAFDDCLITRKLHAGGSEQTVADSDASYTTATLVSPMIEASASPKDLAAAASVYVRLKVDGTLQVKVYASGAGGVSRCTVWATIQ